MASDATKAELSEALDTMIEEVRLSERSYRIDYSAFTLQATISMF